MGLASPFYILTSWMKIIETPVSCITVSMHHIQCIPTLLDYLGVPWIGQLLKLSGY